MQAWIRGALLTAVTFGICWGGAIWIWRATDRMPSTTDLAVYMLALPLVLLTGAFALARFARARAAAPSATASAAAAPAASSAAAPVRAATLALLGAGLRTAHGESVDELAGALAAQRARPDLDPELVDDAGFPVLSVRVASADTSRWRDEAEPWLAAQGHADLRLRDAHWRALELASDVALELAETAAPGGGGVADAQAHGPLLRIVALAPADWTVAERGAAGAWFAHLATHAGWNASRVTISLSPPGEPAVAVSALFTLLAGQADSDGAPALTMLLAFDSRLDQAIVDRISADGRLFTASHPQGIVPGEGAAGLLVAPAAYGRQLDAHAPSLQVAGAVRAASADATTRVDATDLRRLAGQLLSDAAVGAADVSQVFADADHRSSRVLEVMALAHDDLPHLDAGTDVRTTGPACGQCGAVPLLTGLALAHRAVRNDARAALCLGVDDPVQRSAALVRPASEVL